MVLNRRVLRILKENKLRYLGIFMLIILGSYTFIVAAGLSQNLANLVTTFTEEHMQEDLSFSTDRVISDRAELEKEFDVIIEEYMSFDAELSDTLTLRLLSETEKLNIPAVIEGRGLSGSGEILLDPAFAKANGYSVGSQIEMADKTFTVVGFVSLPHYIYPLKNVNDILYSPNDFGVAVINREEFSDIDNVASIYSVRFNDRTQSLNRQAVQFRERLRVEGITVSDWIDIMNNKRARVVWASIIGMKTMSVPLPAAMFLLSCLIIGIMFWRMIRQESVIVGTLYAQGYRRRELTRHYMAIPLLLAFAGGMIGSLLALPSIEPMVMAMISYYNVPVPGIKLSFLNVLIGILTPTIFLGLSSYLVIRSELKRSPAELMKGDKQKTKVNALERAFKLERFKFSTKFKLREQFRSISRLVFLFLGVTSASVLMLFGFTILNSMNHVFNTSDVYQFEYEYAFRDLQFGEAPEGAEAFNAGKFYPENNEGIEFYITGIKSDSRIVTLKDSKGNPIPNNQTNITKALANRLGIKAGDTVTFINKEDGKPYTFHIDAIADSYVEQFIYVPITEFNKKLGLPENSYMGVFSTIKLDIPSEKLSGIKSMSEMPNAMDEFFGQMISMVALMTIVSSIVALIILYLVTSLIIEENRNTISLFKVFGYRRREIKSMILNSSTFVIVAGFILSIPIMAASMGAIYGYLGNMINLVLPTIISPLYVVVCFVVIMLTYQLSKLLCAKRVNEVSMSEALKVGTE
ncbi:MAG: FtsX-like permease family protein [Syntrophomonadaceae bacterium]|jgi:putative ABC transport system permease protein|nr:ABC transporter permease [Bacillota bacterium]MDI9480622.1 ABC transporter permease [Bacillota bacterium]NLM87512.1 FtsX-like permease family protein [Syntrophomonadaceae bacterium]NLP25042.1 FtsX-like permease family protein [Syntrophomonadaceae bacterium]